MTKLLFGVHMHQPVDNLYEAVEDAITRCYEPFFKMMSRYPKFRFALHASGWILEYIQTKHPELFETIKKCNIELFTGGYYEPVLASIDKRSQVAQIKKLNSFLYRHFKARPKGLWLTERVWEGSIIPALKKCKLEYAVIDDYHLYSAKVRDIEGFYTTEQGGKRIGLFAINKTLRYKIPFSNVEEALEEIKSLKSAIIFDDLEKFGLWPKTYEWVYTQGWLERFVEGVIASRRIKSMHFSEFYATEKTKGLVYPQNVSYAEMNEWSLKEPDIKTYANYEKQMGKEQSALFLRGGMWKDFFLKYSESNRIHKRMLEFLDLQNDMLFKLQTNDVFWHGAFGGLYLPNLRDNAYRYLIECENTQRIKKESKDVECLGCDQVKYATKRVIARFSQKGGALIEFDDRENTLNYQNTLTRRREFYHTSMLANTAENGAFKEGVETIHNLQPHIDAAVREQLFFDRYEKVSFLDFVSDDFCLENFISNSFHMVKDFSKEVFNQHTPGRKIIFESDGLRKEYTMHKEGFTFENSLFYTGNFQYIIEMNLHFAHYYDLTINDKLVQSKGSFTAQEFVLQDNFGKRAIRITFEKPVNLHYFLLQTFSQSESGVDAIIQGISLAFVTPFEQSISIKGKIACQR
jgi:4-alpha-glucanotransferase